MNVSRVSALRGVKRIATVYHLPNGTSPEDVAATWAELMADIDDDAFSKAIEVFLREREGGYFPKPGAIRSIALKFQHRLGGSWGGNIASQYGGWEQDHANGRCPVCQAGLRLLKAVERGIDPSRPDRYGVWHDVEAHRRAGVPHVGFPCETLTRSRASDTERAA